MKKIYFQPSIKVVKTQLSCIICNSKDIQSNNGIGYGGVDKEGTKDPASRRYDNWDDEEDIDY